MANDARSDDELSTIDQRVLENLARVGAATPIEIEVKADLIGEPVRNELRELLKRGLVRSRRMDDEDVYYLSSEGRRLVAGAER